MEIGRKLKSLVELRKINKAELARQMSMTEQNLYKIFKKPSIDTELLCAFSQHLAVPITYFFDECLEKTSGTTQFAEPDGGALYQQGIVQKLQEEVAHLQELNRLKDELIAALKRE